MTARRTSKATPPGFLPPGGIEMAEEMDKKKSGSVLSNIQTTVSLCLQAEKRPTEIATLHDFLDFQTVFGYPF
jgi:hypothetical protein